MDLNQIIQGRCEEVLKTFDDNFFDTIITDPPYGLGFMGKEWDTFKPEFVDKAMAKEKRPHTGIASQRRSNTAGSYDFSRNAEFQQWFTIWAIEALRVAKPGCIMLIFGGTRTYHRLACAVEDAGWQIRDCMMWIYGSGFPKSHNIGKKVEGWDGWGTALKPAWEPILVAMKPLDGTFAANAEKWGCAGLNIDGARIVYENTPNPATNPLYRKEAGYKNKNAPDTGSSSFSLKNGEGERNPSAQGRWPANLILDEESARLLDEQAPLTGAFAKVKSGHSGKSKGIYHDYAQKGDDGLTFYEDGLQGASRFFYCAKASRAERNMGLEGMEATLFSKAEKEMPEKEVGIQVPNNSRETKGERIVKTQNSHPTVKPLKLMEYLCNLTKTPTGGVILDCFAGSGTTGMACINTGRDYVLIEKEPEYVEIAKRRIEAARKQKQNNMALFEKGK